MEPEGETPKDIERLVREIQRNPYQRIKDSDLREMGLEPAGVRRWFKKNHNMTFQGYQRLIRINSGYQQIKLGEKVIDAAFDTGFESLSGFNERYREIFGTPPTKGKSKGVIYLERFSTPLGPMFAGATEEGLCLLEFTDRRMLEREFKDLSKRLNAVFVPGSNEYISQAKEELGAYFAGRLQEFSVKLFTPGTEFQQRVWNVLQKIPYGETRSYLEQAKKLGNPKAVRAVARANGMNRIAIIIPCHRVIGSDGALTGYAGGLPRKEWLLDMEIGKSQAAE
jgi:AraC family transcriptional regulator of adaptative response/methylated-DNA-[protein]-cysteine methyltransferase